jgi:hypothetical protein
MSAPWRIFLRRDAVLSEIQPLRAFYNETEFKSRLEARTAYYFDLLGIRWQYEPEGFALHSGNYLPDFLCNNDFYLEVKPDYSALDIYERKLRELCQITKKKVFYFPGLPQEPSEVDVDQRWGNYSFSWRYDDTDRTEIDEEVFGGMQVNRIIHPDDRPFLNCPYTCKTKLDCHNYFVWYAFCRKGWGVPYYGCFESGYEEDVYYLKRARGLKFDRAGRAVI